MPSSLGKFNTQLLQYAGRSSIAIFDRDGFALPVRRRDWVLWLERPRPAGLLHFGQS